MHRLREGRTPIVFMDFDKTITVRDTLDDMLEKFSRNDAWVALEEKWKAGSIGSRECLDGQIRGIGITKRRLNKYLTGIKIDPFFKQFVRWLDTKSIETIILTDNFDYIVSRILKHHGVKGLPVYSNTLKIEGDRLTPHFTFTDKKCPKCAHCKRMNLLDRIGKGHLSIYIGDGLSDVCAAKEADVVFAKGYLKEYFRKKKRDCVPFGTLKDVYEHFKKFL